VLIGSFLLAQPSLPAAVTAAEPEEICTAKADPSLSSWSCTAPDSKTVFWVPCEGGAQDLVMTQGIRTVIVYSTRTNRRLTVLGTTSADVLIGGPGTNETLQGSSGPNTYIVGGSSTTTVASNDELILTATSDERDTVQLTSSRPDYIHINAPAQSKPGSLITATSPTEPVPLRGSSDLGQLRNELCATTFLERPSLYAQQPVRLAMGGAQPFRGCANPAVIDSRQAADGIFERDQRFPGVVVLQGFDPSSPGPDRIVLPADDYLFRNASLQDLSKIPVLIVDDVRIGSGRIVSAKELPSLRRAASGLTRVSSDRAPLIYFRQHGLLVFSQNAEPLGSAGNPGRVIARLLDGGGNPLELRKQPGEDFVLARFVMFTSSYQKAGADRLR
jgi:hypothetical protein